MTPAEFAIKRPVAICMIFVSCLVLGGVSSKLLPLEYFPEVDVPFLFIDMPYPGSTPEEVEESILRPAEESLSTIKGIQFMNANANPSGAQIFMAFDWTSDLTAKTVDAREQLDAIRDELPSDLRRINVFKFNTSDAPILQLRISSDRNLSESYDLLNRNLVKPIERIPGVARVELQGVEPKEINIELISDRVEAAGIDLNTLSQTLQSANFAASAGTIDDTGRRFRVNPIGDFDTVQQYRDLVLDTSGTRLGDIAEITFLPGERNYSRNLDQNYAVGVQVFKERNANLVNVAEQVVATIREAGERPEMSGIAIIPLDDQAEGILSSISELLKAGLLGALLSLIVLYFFLRNWTTTLMVSLSVPISITIALGFMYLTGFSLNVLSMMGLMLAVGMLVDNAVVVSEAIFTEREKMPDAPVEAARRGIYSVGMAVLAGTMTTMAVFMPNIFGEMNQIKIFLQHVAVAICISLAASLVIAQTLIPMVSARVSPPSARTKPNIIDKLKERYAVFLRWTMGHRWWAWAGILIILISWTVPWQLVERDMFPQTLTRTMMLRFNLDSNYTLKEIEPHVNTIEDFLMANKEEFEIRHVYTYYDEQGTAQTTVLLNEENVVRSSVEIKEDIIERLPKIPIGRPSFDQNRSAGAEGTTIALTGDSSKVLRDMSADVIRALESVEGLRDIKPEIDAKDREVTVTVDRDRAARYGLSAQSVAQNVAIALRGAQLSEFQGPDGEVPVWLRFQESDTQSVDALSRFTLATPTGERVPLTAVVEFNVSRGPERIQRQDRQTVFVIKASLEEGVTMDQVRDKISGAMDAIQFAPGYGWKFGRGFQFNDDTAIQMVTNIGLAILFIYLIMAALFESLILPISIVTGILFSIIGVFWFFLFTGTTFSIMAFIGILILIGVVVNNGIVLVDHINQLRRQGLRRTDAIVQGGRDRLRPILMTVGTTVLGLLPLCIGTTQLGGDGPPYFPMARAIVGGLVFSTVVSLCVLPTIYATVDDAGSWVKDRVRQARYKVNKIKFLNRPSPSPEA